jgi:hypothetical protein
MARPKNIVVSASTVNKFVPVAEESIVETITEETVEETTSSAPQSLLTLFNKTIVADFSFTIVFNVAELMAHAYVSQNDNKLLVCKFQALPQMTETDILNHVKHLSREKITDIHANFFF